MSEVRAHYPIYYIYTSFASSGFRCPPSKGRFAGFGLLKTAVADFLNKGPTKLTKGSPSSVVILQQYFCENFDIFSSFWENVLWKFFCWLCHPYGSPFIQLLLWEIKFTFSDTNIQKVRNGRFYIVNLCRITYVLPAYMDCSRYMDWIFFLTRKSVGKEDKTGNIWKTLLCTRISWCHMKARTFMIVSEKKPGLGFLHSNT